MIDLLRYDATAAIPPALAVSIRALLHAEWPGDEDDVLLAPTWHPVHFVLADGAQVVSYARTIWQSVSHFGQQLKLYGLGDVVTQPRWRRKGCGGRIVQAATAHIQSNRAADAAVLLTEPALAAFYQRSGWRHVAGLRVTTDEGVANFPMMLFLSAQARAMQADFSTETLVLPGDEW